MRRIQLFSAVVQASHQALAVEAFILSSRHHGLVPGGEIIYCVEWYFLIPLAQVFQKHKASHDVTITGRSLADDVSLFFQPASYAVQSFVRQFVRHGAVLTIEVSY